MEKEQMIREFWQDVVRQDPQALRKYFAVDGVVFWHNTNEWFTVEEYKQWVTT